MIGYLPITAGALPITVLLTVVICRIILVIGREPIALLA
jgi:hypothetical protein